MKIALTDLHADMANARIVPPSLDQIESMANSLASLGQLQPIAVRKNDGPTGGWWITIGKTRVEAARKLGWQEIDATEINGVDPDAASAAENMVRSAMHPVDCWRALAKLRTRMSVEDAGARLGLPVRYAYQLDQLSRIAPTLVTELAREAELPTERELRTIAAAPHDRQIAALQAYRKANRANKDGDVDWYAIANGCRMMRIPLIRAIFDVSASGVAFEQDFFVEPGADDEWTTADTEGFMAAQRAALKARVDASKGRMILGETNDRNGTIKEPSGYRLSWEPVLKKFRKDDPRKVIVTVATDGFHLGTVIERMAYPKVEARAQPAADGAQAGEAQVAEAQNRERGPITKATLAALAALQGQAVRQAMPAWADRVIRTDDWKSVVAVLLHLFGAKNIDIRDGGQVYARHSYGHLLRPLIDDEGKPASITDRALLALVGQVLDRAVMFQHPNSVVHSGAAAHWIAQLVDAEGHCPRFDTAEIMKGFSRTALQEVARAHDIDDSGTRPALIARMAGKMPGWCPVTFGAVPTTSALDDFDDDDAAEQAEPEPEPPAPPVEEPAPMREAAQKATPATRKRARR